MPSTARPDYFTLVSPSFHHFSTETPLCSPVPSSTDLPTSDPINPLLSYRHPTFLPSTSSDPTMSLMQSQTAAAHGQPTGSRPRPCPMQNVLHVSSDDDASTSPASDRSARSSVSEGSDSGRGASSPPEFARCSRCHRTPSLDIHTRKSNMVRYGLNLWYCNRCAGLVGYQ